MITDYSEVKSFAEMLSKIDNVETLECVSELLDNIIELNKMKERIRVLEDDICKGGKAMFYFFVGNFDEQEAVFAHEKVLSRMKRLVLKNKK